MTAHRMRSPGPIRQVPVGASGAGPYAITNGPDSALWIALETGAIGETGTIGRIDR
jgi:streptogramin lyase